VGFGPFEPESVCSPSRGARKTRCLTPGNSDGKKVFDITEMEADHIKPWHEGGRTEAANCQMLCKADNRAKGGA
jgi:5-methylcytosine-specific restriction endonuclease McrA